MTNRVADDFAAIRKRLDELTQDELKHVETDTGDEHTIAVQPSTGKRYKWINGSWTEEEFTLTGWQAVPGLKPVATWTVDEHELTYEEWAKQGHTLLDYMI